MNQVRVRLITTSSVRPEEVQTAIKATGYFRRYGVVTEQAILGKKALRDVRYAAFIRDVLTTPETHFTSELANGRILDAICEFLRQRTVIGVGMTNESIYKVDGTMKRELIGAGSFASCAFVSTRLFDTLPLDIRLTAIEISVKHELGHTLMDFRGHCTDKECIMQSNEREIENVLNFARNGFNFCRTCDTALRTGITRIQNGQMSLTEHSEDENPYSVHA